MAALRTNELNFIRLMNDHQQATSLITPHSSVYTTLICFTRWFHHRHFETS